MVHITRREMAEIASQFGHRDLSVKPTIRGTWVATCSCGMRTNQRRTAELAAQAAAHHVQKVVQAWRAAGSPLPLPLETPIRPEGKGANAPAAASTHAAA